VFGLALVGALSLVSTAGAGSGGALAGKTYRGQTSKDYSTGSGSFTEGVPRPLQLKVAKTKNGETVTVTFTGHPVQPLFYCPVGVSLARQATQPASISGDGSFKATVHEHFTSEPDVPPTDIVSGKFSGRSVKGTITTKAGTCGGTTRFAATAG
jgi:hypothetical protein